MIKRMTFDDYEKEIDFLSSIGYMPEGFWPTVEEIRCEIEPEIRKNLLYLIWLSELNPTDNLSKENRESFRYIKKLLNSNLELIYEK